MASNPDIQSISIRFPAPLLARVRERAAADRRSLHGELLWLLERALAVEDARADGDERRGVAPVSQRDA